MNPANLSIICLLSLGAAVSVHAVEPFSVRLAEPAWDGVKVPAGQQCQKFGGKPATPALRVRGLPENANALVMAYSDRDNERMDRGGHGIVGFALNAPREVVDVPPAPGHTFELPPGFFTVAAHRNPKWDVAGAYMPPCSGGKNHAYYVTVKAVRVGEDRLETLAETVVELGKY